MDRAHRFSRKLITTWVCLLLLGTTLLPAGEVRVGYRRDHLRWSIGIDGIDILSELTWRQLNIIEVQGYASRCWGDGLLFEGWMGAGWIVSGEDQDSDYLHSGRKREFSLSRSQVDGYVVDALAQLGRRVGCVVFTAGGIWNRQAVRSFAGYSEIGFTEDEDGEVAAIFSTGYPFTEQGVNARYVTDWLGISSGLWIGNAPDRCFSWRLAGRVHTGLYHGKGIWELRDTDYFTHIAAAWGYSAEANVGWRIGPHWAFIGNGQFFYWKAAHGKDRIFQDGRQITAARFRTGRWVSWAVLAGVRYIW